jgi:hypothetical protein
MFYGKRGVVRCTKVCTRTSQSDLPSPLTDDLESLREPIGDVSEPCEENLALLPAQ